MILSRNLVEFSRFLAGKYRDVNNSFQEYVNGYEVAKDAVGFCRKTLYPHGGDSSIAFVSLLVSHV
jgi:hypothetical protein